VLGKAIVRVLTRACMQADPPRPIPTALVNFQVSLKRSVYKDPSLHYFDVRRYVRGVCACAQARMEGGMELGREGWWRDARACARMCVYSWACA
jgi:hypothetical protein